MSHLHHLHSCYARLTREAIDFTLERVRDANEVLFGSEALDARDMLRIARSVLETERLFERDPAALLEPQAAGHSDWTLACVAGGLGEGSVMLRQRGSSIGAERARADQRAALRRIVESPRRSPLVAYDAVVSALLYELPPASMTELFELRCLALAEALRKDAQTQLLSLVCDIADSHLRLDQEAAALCIYLGVQRFDPTDAQVHLQMAVSFHGRSASLAHAAASRALLLLRVDEHDLRPQLRRIIEESSSLPSEPLYGIEAALLRELQAPPGKRSRASLRGLCQQLIPQLADLPEKEPEPLPDSAALAQLRLDLKSLPRPCQELSSSRSASPPRPLVGGVAPAAAGVVAPGHGKVGRNEPCPCGSDKKWKRCCGAR